MGDEKEFEKGKLELVEEYTITSLGPPVD